MVPARIATTIRRWRRRPLAIPLAYIAGGIVVGNAMLLIDVAVGEAALPAWLWIGAPVARSSLVGLLTSFLFVMSVVFWVRIGAVQVTAGSLPPRLLSQFLTDRVQQHAMGFLIGAMAYLLAILRALPGDGPADPPVPHLAVTLGYIGALAVAVVIVMVVHNAARASQVGHVLRRIADDAVTLIRTLHPPHGQGADGTSSDGPHPPTEPGHEVVAPDSGWVLQIHEEMLLAALPPGATVELKVRAGSFVLEGQRIATLWLDGDPPDDQDIQGTVALADEPSPLHDIASGINELVDIAQRSMNATTSDSTAAREAVLYLGMVMRDLLLRDLPPIEVRDDRDRRLLRHQILDFGDYCEAAFGRARDLASGSPELLTILVGVMGEIADQLDAHGLASRRDLVRQQVQLALDLARHDLALPRNIERVASRAQAAGADFDGQESDPTP